MKLYGNNPQQKALQLLIHDTNSALSSLNGKIKTLSEYLNKNAKAISDQGIELSTPYVIVEYLKSERENIIKALDSYYESFKNDFETPKT